MALLRVGSAVGVRAAAIAVSRQCLQERIQRNHVRSSQPSVCATIALQARSVSMQVKRVEEPQLLFDLFVKNPDLRHINFENKDCVEFDQKFWNAFYAFLRKFPTREFAINFEGTKIPDFGVVGIKNDICLSEVGVWRREIEKTDGRGVDVFYEPFKRSALDDGRIIRTVLTK